MGDETGEMPGDLGVGGPVGRIHGRDGTGFAELVHLDDIGHDATLHRLPDQCAGERH